MEIELAPGWTWQIWYQWDGENPEVMLARAISAQRALDEANYSLESADTGYTILGLMRDDVPAP